MRSGITFVIFLTILSVLFQPDAAHKSHAKILDETKTYSVQNGETSFDIAKKLGVAELELMSLNGKSHSDRLKAGEQLLIPSNISPKEKELLARLVHAEAKGEPYKGKVAVAAVVLNRVDSAKFPDSIQEVIYQERQFEPVDNGMINDPADAESKKAVDEAMAKHGQGKKALFFFNPDQTDSKWLRTRQVVEEIGKHRFSI